MPPMSSTTTSTSGSATSPLASPVSSAGGHARPAASGVADGDARHLQAHARAGGDGVGVGRAGARPGPRPRCRIRARRPHRRHVDRGCRVLPSTCAGHGLTLPPQARTPATGHGREGVQTSRRTRSSSVSRRTTTRRGPVGDEHHRRAGHLVVIRGHRVAVGAGDRGGQDVADRTGRPGPGRRPRPRRRTRSACPRRVTARGRADVGLPGAGRPRSRCRRAPAAGCRSSRRRPPRRCGRRATP